MKHVWLFCLLFTSPVWSYDTGLLNAGSPGVRTIQIYQLPLQCLPRDKFPERAQNAVPAEALYSGLRLYPGTSRACPTFAHGCQVFSKTEFETLWTAHIQDFSTNAETLFGIALCQLPQDVEANRQTQTAQALAAHASPESNSDPRFEALIGSWCGHALGGESTAEIRITFSHRAQMVAGHAVIAWANVKGGPLGDPNRVDTLDLNPTNENPASTVLTFSEVSHYRTGVLWTLDPRTYVLTSSQGIWSFGLQHACDGFWHGSETP
jgi:hypothetical protein